MGLPFLFPILRSEFKHDDLGSNSAFKLSLQMNDFNRLHFFECIYGLLRMLEVVVITQIRISIELCWFNVMLCCK